MAYAWKLRLSLLTLLHTINVCASLGSESAGSSAIRATSDTDSYYREPDEPSMKPAPTTPMPEFIEGVPNVTVAVGRDTELPCVVKNLQDFKVAFIHLDRQMIVSIHHHVITRIPRFQILHDKHHTWKLVIQNVQQEDKGFYMCQINTDPMMAKVGYVNVVVPPNIVDLESSPSTVSVRENNNASLICKAEGTPTPKIRWRREDKKPIIIKRKKKEGRKERAEVHGEILDLIRISRTEMGAYLCIAKNGVPPSVSKRIILTVEFSPMIWIPNQLLGAPLGTEITLECHTESSPRAISYWMYNENMVLISDRHQTSEKPHSEYKLDSTLTIRNLTKEDFGTYRCVSKNSLGETDGAIMLYELETETEPPKKEESAITSLQEYEYEYDADNPLKRAKDKEVLQPQVDPENKRRNRNRGKNRNGDEGYSYGDFSGGRRSDRDGRRKGKDRAEKSPAISMHQDSSASSVRLSIVSMSLALVTTLQAALAFSVR